MINYAGRITPIVKLNLRLYVKVQVIDYSDAYILVRDSITAVNTEVAGAAANNNDKKIIFKNCAPFTDNPGR